MQKNDCQLDVNSKSFHPKGNYQNYGYSQTKWILGDLKDLKNDLVELKYKEAFDYLEDFTGKKITNRYKYITKTFLITEELEKIFEQTKKNKNSQNYLYQLFMCSTMFYKYSFFQTTLVRSKNFKLKLQNLKKMRQGLQLMENKLKNTLDSEDFHQHCASLQKIHSIIEKQENRYLKK